MVQKVHAVMDMEDGGAENARKTEEINTKKPRVYVEKMKNFPIWKVGKNDPRRVIHSLKVGLALTLVSLLYLLEPLFEDIGSNAIWAVMTVVVVLEFTAGATLCKGLNRAIGTVLAGSLAFLIEFVANESGRVFRAIFIGAAVFFVGAAATYMRFFPYMKKNFDYGIVIFLLTFNLITVSSYRHQNVLVIAKQRFYTIAIGCAICLVITLLIFPIWSGEDLHNNTVYKLEGLAKCIEGCVYQYFKDDSKLGENQENSSEDSIYDGYKTVLDSKSIDETLALHASWEPRLSRFCYKFPSQQYVKVGMALRRFGYTVVALHGCLQTEIQTPLSVRALFKDPCIRLAGEVTKALMELAKSVRNHRHCSPEILSDHLHEALQDLNTSLRSQPRLFLGSNSNQATNMLALAAAKARQKHEKDSLSRAGSDTVKKMLSRTAITSLEFSEALPFAAFASLLVETVARLDNVIEEVEELGRVGGFKEYDPCEEVAITCEEPKLNVASNHMPSHATE